MSARRLSKLIAAVDLAVRYTEDEAHVERVLQQALRALVNPMDVERLVPPVEPNGHRRDAMGAPIFASGDAEWENLRAAVRSIAAEIGWPAAARRFGSPAATLKDIVYRSSRRPGPGRQARLMQVVTGGQRH